MHGSPGYEVSDQGDVRNARTGRVLRPQLQVKGYHRVHLGRARLEYVHTLVAEAFICPRPPGHEVDHLDRCRTNNAAANLRWLPKIDNATRWWREQQEQPEDYQPMSDAEADALADALAAAGW